MKDRFLEAESDSICNAYFSGIGRGNKEDNEIASPARTLPSNENSIINLNYLDRDYF